MKSPKQLGIKVQLVRRIIVFKTMIFCGIVATYFIPKELEAYTWVVGSAVNGIWLFVEIE